MSLRVKRWIRRAVTIYYTQTWKMRSITAHYSHFHRLMWLWNARVFHPCVHLVNLRKVEQVNVPQWIVLEHSG